MEVIVVVLGSMSIENSIQMSKKKSGFKTYITISFFI